MGYFLENLTWPRAEKAFKETKFAVVPTGSCEQHGPHLPIGTDYFTAKEIASRVVDRSPVVATPTMPIGYADYHADFPGTLSLTEETMASVYKDLCSHLINYGVEHIVFVNGHGGNLGPLTSTMSWLRDKNILAATIMWYEVCGDLNEEWKAIGHGDFIETSLVLAINEEGVDLSKANVPERINLTDELVLNDIRDCRFKGAPVHVGLRTRDYTETGDMIEFGHNPDVDHSIPPTKGSSERGEEILEAVAEYISDFIEEFKSASIPFKR